MAHNLERQNGRPAHVITVGLKPWVGSRPGCGAWAEMVVQEYSPRPHDTNLCSARGISIRTNCIMIFRIIWIGHSLLTPCGMAMHRTTSAGSTFVQLGHVAPVHHYALSKWFESQSDQCTAPRNQCQEVEGLVVGSCCRWCHLIMRTARDALPSEARHTYKYYSDKP